MKKSKTLVATLVVLALASGNLALAQGNGHGNGRNDRGERSERNDRQRDEFGPRGGPQARPGNARPWAGPNGNRPPMMNNEFQRGPRGAGPDHQFYRGGRLPAPYRSNQYVVNDWRGHNLSAPPRGYHWVQTGGDYVLVAIATGIILQLLLNN
jgi:Ni/Co efflux regulator RcnB